MTLEEAQHWMIDHFALRRGVADWLTSIPWSHWGTFTYRSTPSCRSARFNFESWLDDHPFITSAYWCTERGTIGGRPHNHALLALEPTCVVRGRPMFDETAEAAIASWWRRDARGRMHRTRGRCDVETYDPEKGAAYYVAKYITKAPDDWDVHTVDRRRLEHLQ